MGEAVKKSPQIVTLDRAMKDLPPLPTAVAKILVLTGDQNSRAEELEKFIITDQAISTKVLRVVNSPYFGVSGQVASMSQAVLILGFDQIRNLVLSLGTTKVFDSSSPAVKELHLQLWRHAFASAAAAQFIARRKHLEHKDLDLVFSGGLLSNVGALFLAAQFTKPYTLIYDKHTNDNQNLSEMETKSFNTTHAEIGQQLGVMWKFPENLCIMLGRHEGPFEGDPVPSLYAVHAGDRIASVVCKPRDQWTDEVLHIDPAVTDWLGFDDATFAKAKEETLLKLDAASDMLNLFG